MVEQHKSIQQWSQPTVDSHLFNFLSCAPCCEQWGTPSAHSATQGATVLVHHDPTDAVSWATNGLILALCMFSRLCLAVHWPQDVAVGAVLGVLHGLVVCASGLYDSLLDFAAEHHSIGDALHLSVARSFFVW